MGKNLRGVAVKLPGGREGLAGREWEELMVPAIWEKKGGRVKWEVVGGPTGMGYLDSMTPISFRLTSLWMGW